MDTLTFLNASETRIVINSQSGPFEINYNRIVKIESSVLVDYKKIKQRANTFIIFVLIILFIGAFTQLQEKKVPDSEVGSIYFRPGHQDYESSKGPVHIAADGSFYYSKDMGGLLVFGFVSFVFLLLALKRYNDIKPWHEHYKNNNHSIVIYFGDGVTKELFVGDFDITKNTYDTIKNYWEKAKMI
jgi:hypothetical protein